MSPLRVDLPDHPEWATVSAAGLHLLVRAGGDLVERVREAAAGGELEEVLDALTRDGVRGTPDFVAVAEGDPVRVVVRGQAYAVASGPAGDTEVRAAPRGPWADVDAPEGTSAVVLRTGDAPVAEPTPQPAAEQTTPPEPEEPEGSGAPGWRLPTLLRRERPSPARPSTPPASAESEPTDASDRGNGGRPPAEDEDGEVDELPSYDHLFGATQHDRPSYIEQHDTGTIEEPPIGHAPIESAGGFNPAEAHGEHTLAPPPHTVNPPQPSPEAAPPPAAPPAQQSRSAPARGGIIDSVPWRSGGSNVPPPDPVRHQSPAPPPGSSPIRPATPSVPSAAPESRVPGPPRATRPGRSMPPTTPPLGAVPPPPAATPPAPAAQVPGRTASPQPSPQPPVAANGDVDATVDRASLLSASGTAAGPLVLAVLCPAGHTSPPHSGTCRQCGRDIPPQQPFQTSRPPLGVLRLPTGDDVTLDRGVLLGRAPRVNAELAAAAQPHLVRVPSPENDISRNHVEILLEGWHVLIRDLGSTNGTTITLPGEPPVRLRPSDQQVLEPGTVITLADEVAITYEVPA